MAETVEENGVKIEIPQVIMKHSEKMKYHNPKLAILREAVLATLKIEADSVDKPLMCLDAFSGSGLTGMQWKLHCGNKVHVILSEQTHAKSNSALNEMEHSDWLLNPSHSTGEWPSVSQNKQEIHVCPYKASVVLHEEAFNFLFLQKLFNGIALCIDSVFSNLRHNGVACFLTPNMTSPCFRCPKIMQRLYQAYTQKTEYVNELAVRVFIADLAKAAARHQRGISVLCTISVEDHFLVVVRVTRNNKSAINCVEKCRPVLHCLMCEERVLYPQTNSPVENPYTHLPCNCKEKHPGKTAVILGPLWIGDIFNVSFIEQLLTKTKDMLTETSIKLRTLLSSLMEEAMCRGEGQSSSVKDINEVPAKLNSSNKSEETSEPANKKQKIENGGEGDSKTQEIVTHSEKVSETNFHKTSTGCKTVQQDQENMPLFYYDLQTKKYKVLPKLDKLVIMLRAAGFRASRTHFEHHAVRTSANLSQLNDVVLRLINK